MSTTGRNPAATAPPLVAGQRLGRAEFHERYEAMPPGVRAELIGGVVYMPSPVGRWHGNASVLAGTWVTIYQGRTPGTEASGNVTTMLDDLGEPQPDALLRILPEAGGQSRSEGSFIAGAPELVVEVSRSTRAVDLGPKRLDYDRAGVLEYVVVALEPNEVIWHARRDGRLERIASDPDGLSRSVAFPGLWFDPAALLAGDVPGVLATLDRGLATPEHAAFVDRLAEARGDRS